MCVCALLLLLLLLQIAVSGSERAREYWRRGPEVRIFLQGKSLLPLQLLLLLVQIKRERERISACSVLVRIFASCVGRNGRNVCQGYRWQRRSRRRVTHTFADRIVPNCNAQIGRAKVKPAVLCFNIKHGDLLIIITMICSMIFLYLCNDCVFECSHDVPYLTMLS